VLSATVSVVLGVDTLAIANQLWHEQGLRAALSGASTAQATAGAAIADPLGKLADVKLVIGWSILPATSEAWIARGIRLLITTLAVSLGGPFWFDLLNKVANARMTGPKPG
jgi:hypothetical protein